MAFTTAHHQDRTSGAGGAARKHLCEDCRTRKARFRYRGIVRADRHHTLCFQCFRAERERQRARQLAARPTTIDPTYVGAGCSRPAFGLGEPGNRGAQLTDRQIAHRRAMLTHLVRQRAVAR